MKSLLTVTAALESLTGIGLLAVPSMLAKLLLGVPVEAPGMRTVAAIGGAGLLSIGVACWLARDDGSSRAGRAILAAITVYNIAAVLVLGSAGFGSHGIALWPAVVLHAVLSLCCFVCLRNQELP